MCTEKLDKHGATAAENISVPYRGYDTAGEKVSRVRLSYEHANMHLQATA